MRGREQKDTENQPMWATAPPTDIRRLCSSSRQIRASVAALNAADPNACGLGFVVRTRDCVVVADGENE